MLMQKNTACYKGHEIGTLHYTSEYLVQFPRICCTWWTCDRLRQHHVTEQFANKPTNSQSTLRLVNSSKMFALKSGST